MSGENNVEKVVEKQAVETSEQPVAASEIPAGDEPKGGAAEGAAPTETPGGQEDDGGGGVLDPETQLAAEALAATEDSAPVAVQETVPVSVVAELRADRRANRQLIEALQSQLAERNKPAEVALEPSPLEKWVAENPEDAEISGPPAKVLVADRKWQAEQSKHQVEQQATQERQTAGQQSLIRAKAALPDFDDVTEVGMQYLTPGDRVDIAMSKDPAMELYKRTIERTLKSGTPDAVQLRQHLQAKLAKAKQSASPKPTVPIQGQGTQTARTAPAKPAENVILTPAIARMRALVDL